MTQIARHWRLQCEQREDALVDLEIATVDSIIVLDDERRELDVLVMQRLDRAVERRRHEVERPERLLLEPVELVLEVLATTGGHPDQPNFPVTYSSVRLSRGFVKMRSVESSSTSSPPSKNAVVSATRAACCML